MIPAELRQRVGWDEGRALILLETPGGVVLLTRDQVKARVRTDLEGLDLVDDLLTIRRKEASAEDAT